MWARDLKGTKFSPLKQLNPQNVAGLKQVWMYRFNRDGHDTITGPSGSELYQEITPIVVNGINVHAVGRSRGRSRTRNGQRNLVV
ncbi:MAG: hypothetical protein WDO18_08400 [Acidobacteriota bacterium]